MNISRRPVREINRFLNVDCSETDVLAPSEERLLLRELDDCKRKLAKALSGIDGLAIAPDSSPQATAHHIAAAYTAHGPEQARLGAVYRRYSELRDKLALANLKLVAHVAKRFRERGIPYSDLLQEGFCGLLEAVDRFDMTHETKLATYATWWIRQAMQRAVASGAYPVRLTPRHLRQLAQNQMPDPHERGMPVDTNGDAGADEQRNELIDRIHTATQPTISLDASFNADSGSGFSLIQTMCDPDGDRTIDIDTDETIEKLLQVLGPRERQVVNMRFGLAGEERLSLSQVGKILAVSKERVRQIEERALNKLRASVAEKSSSANVVLRLSESKLVSL
jgi:RNA polymerase primary sigma factor